MTDKRHLILIVEDEEPLVKALKKKLGKEGFDVLESYDGESGLREALEKHPDLILLDIILPVMDGVTMLEKLREDVWGAKVPVIILSNLNDASAISESQKRGINDYLLKTDWRLDEVIDKVREKLKDI